MGGKVTQDPKERFWSKVDTTGDCWLWMGATHLGYGKFWLERRQRRAHRVSYEWEHGPVGEGLEVDHLCHNPACVKPGHLEAVIPRVNHLRSNSVGGQNARKTHCPSGHPYSGYNLILRKRGTNARRECRECHRLRCQEQRRRASG